MTEHGQYATWRLALVKDDYCFNPLILKAAFPNSILDNPKQLNSKKEYI